MRSRLVAVAAVVAACFAVPGAAQAQTQTPSAALDDAGRLTFDFEVDRFVNRNGRLAARGTAVARLSGPGESTRVIRQRVTAPARVAQASGRRCDLITLTLAPLRLDLLGLRVETSTINLRLRGVRRGAGSGVLGRLLCSIAGSRVNVRPGAARALNAEMPRRGMRTVRATALLKPQAVASQQQASCQILFLQLGPLDLNVLGLFVELYGATQSDPVTITITAFRGGGVLGDLFCGLANATLPLPPP